MNKNNQIQFKSPAEIKLFQESLLRKNLEYLKANSKFYARMFSDNGIDISKILTIEDLQQLPVTTKKDLQIYNNDFLCVDKSVII
ncbi:MAG: phenylacetate--CoA ligase family protein, partial [Bacteroidales bacterium]